jgi:hypothetical protein
LQFDALQRLPKGNVVGGTGLNVRPKCLQRVADPEVVLIECPEAPGECSLEVRHLDVEEHAVAIQAEAARPGIFRQQHVGRHDRRLAATARGTVVESAFKQPFDLTDLIPRLLELQHLFNAAVCWAVAGRRCSRVCATAGLERAIPPPTTPTTIHETVLPIVLSSD